MWCCCRSSGVCSGIVVVGKFVIVVSASMVRIIGVGVVIGGVGSSSGQGVVLLVVGAVQRAGLLHDEKTTVRKSAIAVIVVVVVMVSSLLQVGREGLGMTKLSHNCECCLEVAGVVGSCIVAG